MIPPLGHTFAERFFVRHGARADADVVRKWTSIELSVRGALGAAVSHLDASDSRTFVIAEVPRNAAVGVVTLEPPHLQFAYVMEAVRGRHVGLCGAAIVIEHYFGTTTEDWLGDSGALTSAGAKLVELLAFKWSRSHSCNIITRTRWAARGQQLSMGSRADALRSLST